MTVFGQIVTASAVEEAALATLALWMPTYLGEIERQHGTTAIAVPASYTARSEVQNWPEEHLPAVIAISPGTSAVPEARGDGRVDAEWSLGVAVVVSAVDRDTTRRMAQLYSAAVRAAILQHPSLGGVAAGTVWLAESYVDVPVEDTRTLMAAQVVFVVRVDEVVDLFDGPAVPDEAPYGDRPVVVVADVDVDQEHGALAPEHVASTASTESPTISNQEPT